MPNSSARIGSSSTRGEVARQALKIRPTELLSVARMDVRESESSWPGKESLCAGRSKRGKLICLTRSNDHWSRFLPDDICAEVHFRRRSSADAADDSE